MKKVYLCLGSNVGDRAENCEEAMRQLQSAGEIVITARSEFYVTAPVGGPPQEDYINGVVEVETDMRPEWLLETIKDIERDMGREPSEEKDLPRVIDIDILLYDDVVIVSDELTIPHPRMHERYFVLRGLAEIAPGVVHPLLNRTAEELFRGLGEE
jgi:2-amino-4-hydroxy-6-hydroxymethyldihydropteridine diphosphokinase